MPVRPGIVPDYGGGPLIRASPGERTCPRDRFFNQGPRADPSAPVGRQAGSRAWPKISFGRAEPSKRAREQSPEKFWEEAPDGARESAPDAVSLTASFGLASLAFPLSRPFACRLRRPVTGCKRGRGIRRFWSFTIVNFVNFLQKCKPQFSPDEVSVFFTGYFFCNLAVFLGNGTGRGHKKNIQYIPHGQKSIL